MIVDDVENNSLLIEDHLRSALKCEFRMVSSGREALKILKNWLPDCILMDIMMPEMDASKQLNVLKKFQNAMIFLC